jgi:plasmid stabilization system protein ParE
VNLKFRPEAEEDLKETVIWYENNKKGLGARFLLAVDAAVQSIVRYHQAYPLVYKNYRKKIIRRFPFQIIYTIEENNIEVLAVFHSSRNPDEWKSRIS